MNPSQTTPTHQTIETTTTLPAPVQGEATTLPALSAPEGAWPPMPSLDPVAVYLGRLSPSARRTFKQCLERLADWLSGGRLGLHEVPWPALRYQHTQALRARLAQELTSGTAGKHLTALRGVLKECWRLGYLTADEYHRAVDLKPFTPSRIPRGRGLQRGEVRALFAACAKDDTPAGRRDAALLAMLYGAGLRRSEVAGLRMSDYQQSSGEMKVRGKGDKERLVYATNGSKVALSSWLLVRGTEPGPLFCPVNKGGRIELRGMTDQAIYLAVAKRAEQAGVEKFTPHDLRRSYISDLLDTGADLVMVQGLAGHSNPTTTARYDRRGEEAKKRTAEMLHVPVGG